VLFVKVDSLKAMLARAVAEKNALSKVRSENVQLREQVELLEERIRESDAEIQAQLQIYTAEVEAFQASLDDLKSGSEFSVAQVPIDEMPWDFWSGLLLRIDALMLGDLLIQVGITLMESLKTTNFFLITFIPSFSFQSSPSLLLLSLKRCLRNSLTLHASPKRACIRKCSCLHA